MSGGNETPGEFFERLLPECARGEVEDDDAPAPANDLPMPALSRIKNKNVLAIPCQC